MNNDKLKKYNQKILAVLLTILVIIGALGILLVIGYFIGILG
jgi:cell division protein FtsX